MVFAFVCVVVDASVFALLLSLLFFLLFFVCMLPRLAPWLKTASYWYSDWAKTVFRHSSANVELLTLIPAGMAIVGEVYITKVARLKKVEHDKGFSTIHAIGCRVSGSVQGSVPVSVHIHTRFATFDDEPWRLITMTGGPFDHADRYADLFADSCGSIGDFADIKKYENGAFAITAQMRDYNFLLRRINGKLMAQVFPFDPYFFCTKVRPNGVLLYAPFPSQITPLQNLCIQLEKMKDPLKLLSSVPKYWLEEDRTLSLHEDNRWRSAKTLK